MGCMMTEIKRVMINGRWPLNLPKHRAERPEWPYWEATRLAAMHHFIEPGDVVYDIGAEAGDFSALFATWGADVAMIEPNPKAWPTIKAVWESNDLAPQLNIQALVSEEHRPRAHSFYIVEKGWPPAADNPIDPAHGFHHIGESDAGETSLDFLSGFVTPPDIVTMDVEGGEGHVVRGARRTLTEIKPAVFMSIHPQFMRDLYGEDPKQIHDAMKGYGYHGWFLCEDHEQHWYFGHPDTGRMLPGAAEDYYIPGDRIVL